MHTQHLRAASVSGVKMCERLIHQERTLRLFLARPGSWDQRPNHRIGMTCVPEYSSGAIVVSLGEHRPTIALEVV